MPVKIACPKCSKNYTLPDSALGKAVKCKACGMAFRTRKPDATAQPSAPAKPAVRPASPGARPTSSNPAKPGRPAPNQFGVEDGFQQQADIFGAPPSPRGGAGLGNFAEEGLGEAVAPIVLGPEGGAKVVQANPFESVMTNTALKRGGGKSGGLKRKRGGSGASFDPDRYSVARIGMLIVLASGAVVLMATVFSTLVNTIAAMVPEMVQNLGPAIGIVGMIMGILTLLSMMGFLVGQLICVFAPESNEKMNAGGSLALLFLSFVGGFIGLLVVGVSAAGMQQAGRMGGGPSTGEAAALGIGMLVVMVVCGLLGLVSAILFANYYRAIGKNIKSKQLVSAGNQGLVAIGIGVGAQVLLLGVGVALRFVSDDIQTVLFMARALGFVYLLLWFVVYGLLLRMVMVGVNVLKG